MSKEELKPNNEIKTTENTSKINLSIIKATAVFEEVEKLKKESKKDLKNFKKIQKKEVIKIHKKIKVNSNLLIFGFLVALIMVAGLFLNHYYFLYSNKDIGKNNYNNINNQLEIIKAQQKQIIELENKINYTNSCIKNFGFDYKCYIYN